MPHGVHKNPFLGWNPPAEDSAWARAEAERRGVALSTILTEALGEYRAKHQGGPVSPRRARSRKPREDDAPAAVFVAAEQPRPARAHALNCKCGICRPKKEG
jgi:hypothetical protein